MFGKKKQEAPKELPKQEKTETVDMIGQSKSKPIIEPPQPKLADVIAAEYSREWQGYIKPGETSDEALASEEFTLLLAIYGELRQIRDILAHQATK